MGEIVSSLPDTDEATNPLLRFALYYASKGMSILPVHSISSLGVCTCGQGTCSSAGKHPLAQNGVKDATRSPERLKAWWQQYPYANVGLATGNGWLVIDIDPRHGGSLDAEAIVNLPKTATVRSGSGGWHLYFQYPRTLDLRNTAGRLGPGIDTRGEHGYVVAPPSLHISGERYTWLDRRPPVQAPGLLLQALGAKPRSAPQSPPIAVPRPAVPRLELPWDTSPEDASSVLDIIGTPPVQATESGNTIPEGKRNTTLVSLAGSLRKWGADEVVLSQMLGVMNQTFCQPPLSDEEVQHICTSAVRWMPGTQAQDEGVAAGGGLSEIKDVAMLLGQELPELRWAVPGFLPEGVSLLAGKPKMGKSWLALGLGLAIVGGKTALGRLPTQPGQVLYLGLEDNQRRICDRVRKMLGGTTLPSGLTWGGSWLPLQMGGLDDLETWIKATSDARLVIIDTLARVRPPGNGGGIYAEDYAVITPLKQLAEMYHLSILLVHHLRKGSANDPMDEISGSTGLTGATDCNMVLQRERGQNEAALHITGRDVEEQTLTLSFDEKTACWSIIDASETASTPLTTERQAIIDLLQREGRPLGPTEIARLLDKDPNNVKQKLYQMSKNGQITIAHRGLYVVRQGAKSPHDIS